VTGTRPGALAARVAARRLDRATAGTLAARARITAAASTGVATSRLLAALAHHHLAAARAAEARP